MKLQIWVRTQSSIDFVSLINPATCYNLKRTLLGRSATSASLLHILFSFKIEFLNYVILQEHSIGVLQRSGWCVGGLFNH